VRGSRCDSGREGAIHDAKGATVDGRDGDGDGDGDGERDHDGDGDGRARLRESVR
jgi:hypothetical protein